MKNCQFWRLFKIANMSHAEKKIIPKKGWNGWIMDGQIWPSKVFLEEKKNFVFHPLGVNKREK